MKEIKIFVSNRIDHISEQVEESIYTPVRCGAVFDKENTNPNVIGDDTGDNISEKRMSYCELTVLYWAWKNQKADYYGLCHYRRYLSFTKNLKSKLGSSESNFGCITTEYLNNKTIKDFGLDEASVKEAIKDYDAIFIQPINLKSMNLKNNYDAMRKSPKYHIMKDVDKMIEIVSEKYPHMRDTVNRYMFNYNYNYLYNCFIMNDEIFKNFCSWLFDILFELEKHIDFSTYNISQYRTPGTIAERLLGIWILYLKEQKRYKIKEVPLLFIENTIKQDELKPAFNKKNIAITSNFNDSYAPIFGVFMQSAIENSSPDYNYDFVILSKDISNSSKELLFRIINGKNNVSLRFYDPSWTLSGLNKIIKHNVYTEDLFYRIVVPQIFKHYNKILVVDADMICREDLKNIYNIDIEGYLAAGVKDTMFQGFLNGFSKGHLEYCNSYMKLSNPYDYINTGVLLFNCKEYRETYDLNYLRNFIKKHMDHVRIYEQDMLNMLLDTKIKFLDTKWNSFTITNQDLNICIDLVPYKSVDTWHQGRITNRGILHYANSPKPWQDTTSDMAGLWWEYARKTPFYEQIIKKLCEYITKEYSLKSLNKKKEKLELKYWKYRILRNFVFGKTKKRYIQKKYFYKDKIKNSKT